MKLSLLWGSRRGLTQHEACWTWFWRLVGPKKRPKSDPRGLMSALLHKLKILHFKTPILIEFWVQVGTQNRSKSGPKFLKIEKIAFLEASKTGRVWRPFFDVDLGRFWGLLGTRKWGKVWEGLLGFTFQRSQDNIEFWTVLNSILGGFGLYFGRVLGPKSEK